MPETGNHKGAEKLHNQLVAEGFAPKFGSGNAAGDITYRYEKGKERAYLIATRNGQHRIERKAGQAYGRGVTKDRAVGDVMSVYVLDLKGGKTKTIPAAEFHAWVKSKGERVSAITRERLAQLQKFTGLPVKDWTMEEDGFNAKDRAARLHKALDAVLGKDGSKSAEAEKRRTYCDPCWSNNHKACKGGACKCKHGVRAKDAREREKRRCALCSKLLPNGHPFTNCAACIRKLEAGVKPADIMRGAKDEDAHVGMLNVNADKAKALKRQLENKGFTYRFPAAPPTKEMVRHAFVKRGPMDTNEWRILNERANGYHNITEMGGGAKDAGKLEVKQGRSGNWAVFEAGDDLPVSAWFPSRPKAVEALHKLSGHTSQKAGSKKSEVVSPTIFGYPWEDIQALQQKKITSSELGRRRK
jgi:hypothetical protein